MDAADMTLWGRTSSAWSALLTQTDETNPLWPIYAPMLGARADDRPLVVGQIGQSLDGRVATDGGRRQIINGAAAMVHLHRLRALADAVVVGVGTVVADDPKLTVRDAVGANPARVIIDPAGRLPATAGLLVADGVRRMVVTRTETKLPAGVEAIHIPGHGFEIPPDAIVAALAGLGFRRLLIEGGPRTLSRFLATGCLGRLHIMMSPMIIGSGQSAVQLPPVTSIDAALRPRTTTYPMPGGDVLFDCAFDHGATR